MCREYSSLWEGGTTSCGHDTSAGTLWLREGSRLPAVGRCLDTTRPDGGSLWLRARHALCFFTDVSSVKLRVPPLARHVAKGTNHETGNAKHERCLVVVAVVYWCWPLLEASVWSRCGTPLYEGARRASPSGVWITKLNRSERRPKNWLKGKTRSFVFNLDLNGCASVTCWSFQVLCNRAPPHVRVHGLPPRVPLLPHPRCLVLDGGQGAQQDQGAPSLEGRVRS